MPTNSGTSSGANRANQLIKSNGTLQPRAIMDIRTVVMPANYATNGAPIDLSATYSNILSAWVTRGYTTATKLRDGRNYRINETGTDVFTNGKFRIAAEVGQAITPTGTVSAPNFTGNAATPTGTVAAPIFTGNAATPTGTVAAPIFTGNAVASGGPSATASVGSSGHTHTPTQRSGACVATCTCASGTGLTGTASMAATGAPSATTTVGDGTHTHTTTATGTNSAPTFTGNSATPTGTNSAPTFTGNSATPTGTNSAPTFTGNAGGGNPFQEVSATNNLSAITVEYCVVGIPV